MRTEPNTWKNGERSAEGEEEQMKQPKTMEKVPAFALPPCVVRFLDEPEDSTWKKDHEYFEALLAVECLRCMTMSLSQGLSASIYAVRLKSFATPGSELVVKGRQLNELLTDLMEQLEAKRVRKLEISARRPVLEKFLDALGVSESEAQIFRHVVVRSSGMISSPSLSLASLLSGANLNITQNALRLSVANLREMFAVSLIDAMTMIDSDSIWVKEQLYTRATSPTHNIQLADSNVLNILMGMEITPTQYQAIGSSVLQEILIEDEAFLQTATGKAIKQRKVHEMALKQESGGTNGAPKEESVLTQAMQTAATPSGIGGAIKKDRLYDVLSLVSEQQQKKKKLREDKGQSPADASSSQPMETEPVAEGDQALRNRVEKETMDEFGPYESDLRYLEDQIKLMKKEVALMNLKAALEDTQPEDNTDMEGLDQDGGYGDGNQQTRRMRQQLAGHQPGVRIKKEKQLEKLERAVKQLKERIRTKMEASRRENGHGFRLEQLCEALGLEQFEKYCILQMVKSVIMPAGCSGSRSSMVGSLIETFCSSLEEKMHSRRFFYKSSTLIREGILTLTQQDFMTDLSACRVELDRRLFDYIVGLDTEMSEIVSGSHLYLPDVDLDDVIVPADHKKRICDAVLNFEKIQDTYHKYEVDKKITYGLGQVLLFYGSSGTGKTMLANSIASKLGKKVLLVNFPDLGTNSSGAILKFLFREARINRALLFFDECESLFMDRSKGGTSVNMILTELERFDGLCILATNRAYDLDEAMHRRISLAIEFRKPDHILRKQIWKTLKPPKVPLEENVDFGMLAKKFELTGGLIKNAWLQSVGLMVQRGGDKISQDDLVKAAGEQVIGQLSMEDFDRRVVPTQGVESMVLTSAIKDALNSIVQYTKAQSVLFGQWGFEKIHRSTTGISALFTGAPGCGKTMAAEAIGFDLGRPLLVVNAAELVSKWVGDTGKNIAAVFADAKKKDAVLVFDEAEGLFGTRAQESSSSAGRHDTMNVGLLLQYIENFPGVCIVITNMKNAIDEAFFRRFRFVLDFEMPTATARVEIWKSMIPEDCPLAPDVCLRDLANRYEMCGGDIKNALLRAATHAALRADETKRQVTMDDLTAACIAETTKTGNNRQLDINMFS